MSNEPGAPIDLIVYADFVCPFCYVAEQALLPELKQEWPLRVTWRPFELHPETPPDGRILPKADAGRIWGSARRLAERHGLEAARKAPALTPNTGAALRAAEAARSIGRLDAFRDGAYRAYFVEGRDLNDRPLLQELAGPVDLADPAWEQAVTGARTEALRQCVTAVPAFVVEDRVLFGIREPDVFARFFEAGRGGAGSR